MFFLVLCTLSGGYGPFYQVLSSDVGKVTKLWKKSIMLLKVIGFKQPFLISSTNSSCIYVTNTVPKINDFICAVSKLIVNRF